MDEVVGHILVVDDNRMSRLKLSRSVEMQGHTVETAENGQQALEMLRDESFDAILLDILMPIMDGYDVLSALQADPDLRHIPVIVISAVDETDSAARCIEMGAEDYLPKNFSPVLLRARMAASLRRKRLRDLEQAYLQQEVTLRQSEKLATLGRLSAGMAHELNNPASAALSGAQQMRRAFMSLLDASITLSGLGFVPQQLITLHTVAGGLMEGDRTPPPSDPLERSDLEADMEDWLYNVGIEEPWEHAPTLVDLGLTVETMQQFTDAYSTEHTPHIISWLTAAMTLLDLMTIIEEGTKRISGIVGALKTYSYRDQAPVKNVNIHEGLENTLIMLNNRLKQGVQVQRHYTADLPLIEAHGSELNQVWTNIIDNAISAMEGHGTLSLTTRQEGAHIIVEIADDGPGIPPEVVAQVFDPFFTTKPPGEGTGLGLNISHSIITQKHNGEISVESETGRTCFQIKLPVGR